MRNFLKKLLMIIGGMTLFMGFAGIVTVIFLGLTREDVPEKVFLELDFEKELSEYVPDDSAARMMLDDTPTVLDMIEALQKASDDERVVGLVARIGNAKMGFARVQEIRNAIMAFRRTEKTTVAHSDTFGEFGSGNGSYYLATAFENIYLQPSGDISLTGLMLETSFLKGALDKLGIAPRMAQRHEYKNYMNIFTEEQYTEPHKEALCKIMASVFGQMTGDIGKARNLSPEDVHALTEHGLFLGQEAVNAKLADGLAYRDEVYEKIRAEAGEDVEFLSPWEYLNRGGRLYDKGRTIALIYGVGGVQRGKSRYNPLTGDIVMGSDTLTAAFRAAAEDEDVSAIIFRISSPGGSYVASDSIWRETIRAKAAGKPVIVSMGNVAGSGGYFVAMAADKIVAQPATITGSIGVLGGKMVTAGLWEKLGISWDEINTGPHATMWTGTQDYTPEQWARLQDLLDRIYADFTDKVAEGRHLSRESVAEIARGRVWTGEDALHLGLVDELGGFTRAIRLAGKAAKIPESEEIRLKIFPRKKDILEIVKENISNTALVRTLAAIQPVIRSLKEIGISNLSDRELSVPDWEAYRDLR